jgi:serine kinase of HPr protein (carbohydrate metabolism regulator)
MTLVVAAHLAPVHGALVTRQGIGIALCGDSVAGKSTLAYACARSGWTLICDDGTFLIRKSTDRFAVGNPYNMRFREDARRLFPELAGRVVGLRPNGAMGIEVNTSELPVSTSTGCSIDHVVFLRRSSSGRARMNRYDRGEVLRWLEKNVRYGPEDLQVAQRRAYRRLLDAGLWELHYLDLQEAMELLAGLEGIA